MALLTQNRCKGSKFISNTQVLNENMSRNINYGPQSYNKIFIYANL